MVKINIYIRNKQTTKTWGIVSFPRYNPYSINVSNFEKQEV